MVMKALVEPSGRIAQLEAVGDEFPIAPPLQWVDVPDTTTTLDTWNGVSVDKYVAPPIDPPGNPYQAPAYNAMSEDMVDDSRFNGITEVEDYRANRGD